MLDAEPEIIFPSRESLLTIWREMLRKLGSLQDSGHQNRLAQWLFLKDLQYILETTLKPTIKSFPKYPPHSSFSAMQYGRSQVASFMEDYLSSTLAISAPHFQIPLQSSSPSQGYSLIIATISLHT